VYISFIASPFNCVGAGWRAAFWVSWWNGLQGWIAVAERLLGRRRVIWQAVQKRPEKRTSPLITISVQLQRLSYRTKTVVYTHAHSLQFILGVGHIRCRLRSIVPTFQLSPEPRWHSIQQYRWHRQERELVAAWFTFTYGTQQKVTYINTVWAGVMVDPNLDSVLTGLQLGFGSQCTSWICRWMFSYCTVSADPPSSSCNRDRNAEHGCQSRRDPVLRG